MAATVSPTATSAFLSPPLVLPTTTFGPSYHLLVLGVVYEMNECNETVWLFFLEAPPDSNKTGRCPHCRLALGSEECFNSHVEADRGSLKCLICGYEHGGHHMTLHLRVHTGEKPFFCPHCPYRAASLGTVRVHIYSKHQGKYLFYDVRKALPSCIPVLISIGWGKLTLSVGMDATLG